jgi:hypothetical protein
MQEPISDPDGRWPSCDDEQPGVSIRPLSHADLVLGVTVDEDVGVLRRHSR